MTIDRLTKLYEYIPQGDIRKYVLQEMKIKSDYLIQHEEYLKREYVEHLTKIVYGKTY